MQDDVTVTAEERRARLSGAHALRLVGDGGVYWQIYDDTLGISLNEALIISKVEVLCEGGMYGTPKLRLEIEAPLMVDLKPVVAGASSPEESDAFRTKAKMADLRAMRDQAGSD